MQNQTLIANEPNTKLIENNVPNIRYASTVLRAVKNKHRQQIISALLANKEISVNALCEKVTMQQSIVSQHLAILRNVKLVNTMRNGKQVFYSVNENNLKLLLNCMQVLRSAN